MFDIFFISYGEELAETHWDLLKKRFPYAKRIKNISGIYKAHAEAAKWAFTKFFYVVDADAEVLDTFMFDHEPNEYEQDSVHVWHSKNPVNDLEYGYGGIKLLPKRKVLENGKGAVDLSTSFSNSFKVIETVSCITRFNTDPYSAWRSAFRECVKLSSKVIDRADDTETSHRLQTWCTVGRDRPFGEFVLAGANLGRLYGLEYANDKDKLSNINNFEWLKNEFEKHQTGRS